MVIILVVSVIGGLIGGLHGACVAVFVVSGVLWVISDDD